MNMYSRHRLCLCEVIVGIMRNFSWTPTLARLGAALPVVIVLLLGLNVEHQGVAGQRVSPCPQIFQYTQAYGAEKNRWRGRITIISDEELYGVKINIILDRKVEQLGNFFGEVATNDNTDFLITNKRRLVKAYEPFTVDFYVKFNQKETGIPDLTDILLNGKIICTSTLDAKSVIQGDCGRLVKMKPGGLIKGGTDASISQYPWHVAIYRYTGNNPEYICGGSLITKQHVITAAHCTVDQNFDVVDASKFTVYVGKDRLKSFTTKGIQQADVTTVIVHPGFNKTNYHNDIAILTLKEPVQLSDYVRTICLWSTEITVGSIANRLGVTAGWGWNDNNQLSDQLQQAQLPVVDEATCIRSDPDFFGHFSSPSSFCAGQRNGTSVCNGDSGGGMIFPRDGTTDSNRIWELRGIVSLAALELGTNVCDVKKYVIFTDVAKYLKWIQNSVYLVPSEKPSETKRPAPAPEHIQPMTPPRKAVALSAEDRQFIIFEEPENNEKAVFEDSERISPRK